MRQEIREYENYYDVINEYAKWYATYDWKLYCHMTTTMTERGTCIPPATLEGYWRRFMRYINTALWGKRYRRKGSLSWVIGIETTETGIPHLHGLIGGIGAERICRMCIKTLWEEIGKRTGMARVYSYQQEQAKERGIFYLCKHQIKEGNIIDWFGVVRKKPIRQDKIIHIWLRGGYKVCENSPFSALGQGF